MDNRWKWFALILGIVIIVIGISNHKGHEHVWKSATCISPMVCKECGKTAGSTGNHKWRIATCSAPKHCEYCGETVGETIEHLWIEATCERPRCCEVCQKTEGELLEHSWIAATCQAPKQCSVCGRTEGIAAAHNWKKTNSSNPRICTNCSAMEPLKLPQNGQVFIGANLQRSGRLTIKNEKETETNCYIKLKNAAQKDVFSFFVCAGKNVTIAVPAGQYYVYFSYGTEWYGEKYVFGPKTRYSKDDEILDFTNNSWEYTLYSVWNGNFTETPIDEEEF